MSVCGIVSDSMVKGKGVSIPGFAVFSMRKIKVNRGNWGEKVEFIPMFSLLTSFAQGFGVTSVESIKSTNLGAVPVSPLNVALVSMKAGASKDTCASVIKDIWRKIGELACKGMSFSVDFGVSRLVFQGRRCEAHWSTSFMRQLDNRCNAMSSRALQRRPGSSMSGNSNKYFHSDRLLPEGFDAFTHEKPLRPKTAQPVAQKAKPMPGTPPEEELHIADTQDARNISSVRAQLQNAIRYGRTNQSSEAPDQSLSPSRPVFSPFNTSYISRKRNKAWYRKQRNAAYSEAWEQQKQAREEQRQVEKRKDRERMAIIQERAQIEDDAAKREQQERRSIAEKIQAANKGRMSTRSQTRPAPQQQFTWGDDEPRKLVSLSQELKQLEEKRQQKVREKREANKADLERLQQQQRIWEEEEREEKEQRHSEQREMMRAYQEFNKSTARPGRASEQASFNTSGNFFFKSMHCYALTQHRFVDSRVAEAGGGGKSG
eukprot:TRINITY_DN11590_c0_g1_i3.p1 TRINITY_DN11590_c0_g1~~TRINITY_DN11590_c0_g1_i3.p1  ORF type:complete len:545 (+),score=116.82 TRINITY_DN11590_c0_g1_i3:177-1637(+)